MNRPPCEIGFSTVGKSVEKETPPSPLLPLLEPELLLELPELPPLPDELPEPELPPDPELPLDEDEVVPDVPPSPRAPGPFEDPQLTAEHSAVTPPRISDATIAAPRMNEEYPTRAESPLRLSARSRRMRGDRGPMYVSSCS
jgi:hypothetical protein